jgi:hypothetical protein
MDAQQASQTLMNEVWKPVFLEKLACDWGIVPSSPEEEERFITFAGELRVTKEREKAAGHATTPALAAIDAIEAALGETGQPVVNSQSQAIKQAAANAARRPDLLQAGEVWLTHLMSQLQGAA